MDEGVILKWLVKEGDYVNEGDPLFEVETDKVSQEVESEASGYVLKIIAEEQDTVPVGVEIALLGEKDEEIVKTMSPEVTMKEQPVTAEVEQNNKHEQDVQSIGMDIRTVRSERIAIAPRAKKIATEKGVDLTKITGSGEGGMITVEDIDKFLSKNTESGVKLTGNRAIIAKRLTQSNVERPHVYFTRDIDLTECIEIKSRTTEKVTITDFIVFGIAKALREFPIINARLNEDEIIFNEKINVGLAVQGKTGLIVPKIKHADKMSLVEISKQREHVVTGAKQGTLSLKDLEDGTFTISNLGMYHVDQFTSIINPPESAILSVGQSKKKFVITDNQTIQIRDLAKMTLAVDHRIIDGADAAKFFDAFARVLEEDLKNMN
ncbi:MAG: 2-oxo acid dehydrogenase subunit E2 [Eubacteriaceae bacterium]|nr:2-oxo acid dehydrogenase subunit E2 [Eubacteriaceae bacterium]